MIKLQLSLHHMFDLRRIQYAMRTRLLVLSGTICSCFGIRSSGCGTYFAHRRCGGWGTIWEGFPIFCEVGFGVGVSGRNFGVGVSRRNRFVDEDDDGGVMMMMMVMVEVVGGAHPTGLWCLMVCVGRGGGWCPPYGFGGA
jgi:hypothetical protein